MKHLISPLDLSVEELDQLLDLAQDIEANPKKYAHACDGKKLATLFYEPSTRTRLSHEAAMLNLGGSVMGFSSADSSSASKGESVSDTIRVISCYADICAMRHPKEGAPIVASQYSTIPIINAGDGGHQHPTQTLTDLLTIRNLKGRLNNMTIGLCGDLKFGRTVHSLINALVRYEGIRFVLISPEELRLPEYIRSPFFLFLADLKPKSASFHPSLSAWEVPSRLVFSSHFTILLVKSTPYHTSGSNMTPSICPTATCTIASESGASFAKARMSPSLPVATGSFPRTTA